MDFANITYSIANFSAKNEFKDSAFFIKKQIINTFLIIDELGASINGFNGQKFYDNFKGKFYSTLKTSKDGNNDLLNEFLVRMNNIYVDIQFLRAMYMCVSGYSSSGVHLKPNEKVGKAVSGIYKIVNYAKTYNYQINNCFNGLEEKLGNLEKSLNKDEDSLKNQEENSPQIKVAGEKIDSNLSTKCAIYYELFLIATNLTEKLGIYFKDNQMLTKDFASQIRFQFSIAKNDIEQFKNENNNQDIDYVISQFDEISGKIEVFIDNLDGTGEEGMNVYFFILLQQLLNFEKSLKTYINGAFPDFLSAVCYKIIKTNSNAATKIKEKIISLIRYLNERVEIKKAGDYIYEKFIDSLKGLENNQNNIKQWGNRFRGDILQYFNGLDLPHQQKYIIKWLIDNTEQLTEEEIINESNIFTISREITLHKSKSKEEEVSTEKPANYEFKIIFDSLDNKTFMETNFKYYPLSIDQFGKKYYYLNVEDVTGADGKECVVLVVSFRFILEDSITNTILTKTQTDTYTTRKRTEEEEAAAAAAAEAAAEAAVEEAAEEEESSETVMTA